MVGAEWAPDSKALLVAHSGSSGNEGGGGVQALHLTADPPSLSAQGFPLTLALPDEGGEREGGGGRMEGMAWDGSGQRLAVVLKSGGIAMYDTRCDPMVTARLIGVVHVGGEVGSDSDWEMVDADVGGEEEAVEVVAGGKERKRKSGEGVSMAFMPTFSQGAVLSVRKGERVSTIPLYFSL